MLSNWKIKSRLAFFTILSVIFLPSTQAIFAAQLNNPLGTTDIKIVIARIIRYLLGISGGVALLMFVWGGFQYLMAGANPDYAKKGKDTLKHAAIGLTVIFMSYILVTALVNALTTGDMISDGNQPVPKHEVKCPTGQTKSEETKNGIKFIICTPNKK